MKKFKTGEEVIALSTQTGEGFQKRIKGQSYIVNSVMFCRGCGIETINITGVSSVMIDSTCNCGNIDYGLNMMYTNSIHFVRAEDLEARIEEAEEAQNYELAGFLLSTLNEMG